MRPDRPGVLLLGVEETPALAIIWSLAKQGVPLTVGSSRRICAGMLSRFPIRRLLYPDPASSPDRFLEWLVATLRSGEYPVTMACGEQATYLLSKHKPALAPHTSIPIVEIDTFIKCRDKSLTMKAAAACGVPTPVTWFPEDIGIDGVAARATYPAVVKPCVSDGARGISFVHSPDELCRVHMRTREQYGPCIVQEFVPHQGMQYKAEFLLDRAGVVRLGGAYAKLRYYPPTGGSSTLNRTVLRKDVLEMGARLLTYLRWYGMGDCDFILDPRDGVTKLMEVNPRFTRTIRVLVEAGIDYPFELYRLALGHEPRDRREYRENVFLRYLPADLIWFLRSPERFRARPSFFRFISKDLHYEEWSLRDPLAGVGFWGSLLLDMLDPAARRNRLR
ncbi:MAG: ATP-grasp domain-containing protein [Candidatus Rokubacteria bacterium]|nr:ATP-grasp domain-containing protein [Candidatus Rokubacteria bacterium]